MAAGEFASIGFVGLGDMGSKQARLIARLPVALTVFDRRQEAMAALADCAGAASSLAELGAASDLVGICVQDDAQLEACAAELLPAMRHGAVLLVHATVAPDTVIALARRAETRGITVVDAPVTRTRMNHDEPFLFCPVGGTADQMARIRPVLDSFASHTLLAGPTGAAMTLKICGNLVVWCQAVIGMEAVRLAKGAGVAVKDLLDLMGANGVLTPPISIFAGFADAPPDNEGWRQAMRINAAIGEKDLRLAEQLAAHNGVDLPLGIALRALVAPTLDRLAGGGATRDEQP